MPRERRVYIVDDDEAVRDSLSMLLEAKRYAVQGFGSAIEFLAAALSLPAGCLIVDIRMPEMDGLELQQRLIDRNLGFPLIDLGISPRSYRVSSLGAASAPVSSSLGTATFRLPCGR